MVALTAYEWGEKTHTRQTCPFLKYGDLSYIVEDNAKYVNQVITAMVTALRCGRYIDFTHKDRNSDIIVFECGKGDLHGLGNTSKLLAKTYGQKCSGHLHVIPASRFGYRTIFADKIEQYRPQFVFVQNLKDYCTTDAEFRAFHSCITGLMDKYEKLTVVLGCVSANKQYFINGLRCENGKQVGGVYGRNLALLERYGVFEIYNIQTKKNISYFHGEGENPHPLQKGELTLLWYISAFVYDYEEPTQTSELVKDLAVNLGITLKASRDKVKKAVELGLLIEENGICLSNPNNPVQIDGIWRFTNLSYEKNEI